MADKVQENPTAPPEIEVTGGDVASGGSSPARGKKGMVERGRDALAKFISPKKRQKSLSPDSRMPSASGEEATSKSPAKKGIVRRVGHFIHPTGTDQKYQKLQEEGRGRRKSSMGVELSISSTKTKKAGKNVKVREVSSSVSSASSESIYVPDDEVDGDSKVQTQKR